MGKTDVWDMTRDERAEAAAFCRQYRQKMRMASALLGITSHSFVERRMIGGREVSILMMRASGRTGDPVHRAARLREKYLHDVDIINQAASVTRGGRWGKALVANVCDVVAYEDIPNEDLPTSNRNAFFAARREFLCRVMQLRMDLSEEEI